MKRDKKHLKNIARFASIGFQLLAAIALLGFLGSLLDRYLPNKSNIYTLIGALLGVFVGLYLGIKDVLKK